MTGLKRLLLRAYGRLPWRVKRGLVRAGSPTWLVGSACVIEHDGRLLLVRHSYMRHWGLPGGGLRRHEVPEAAAVRESFEEVGLAVVPVGPPALVADPGPRRLDVVQRCRLAPGADASDARPSSAEIVEVRWVPVAELGELKVNRTAAAALRQAGYVIRR
jgi:ADP-ribose pyrophosphatase YjhB (NUDIX family)